MTQQQLSQLYITHEPEIKASLLNQHIFDEDLFQDTCLEICVYAQHNNIRNFPGLFIERYKKLLKRQAQPLLDCIPYDNAQLAALDIIDETQDIENLDERIDWNYGHCSDYYKEQLQQLLEDYKAHPQPGERNHRRACKILQLYLDGKSEREIASKLKIKHQTVHQYITSIIARLKTATL